VGTDAAALLMLQLKSCIQPAAKVLLLPLLMLLLPLLMLLQLKVAFSRCWYCRACRFRF
jgi:hypothetical protein